MKYNVIEADEREIAKTYNLSPLAAKVLAANNLSKERIEELLAEEPCRTSHAPCVTQAVERLVLAKERGEKVFIGGDYDADGICSTAIMKKTLDVFGIESGYYIPNRLKEGYGLNVRTVEQVKEKGYSLIITVDNGVKAHDALKKAKELGMDVIVTDHHMIEEEVECDILVHPNFMEEEFSTLSGAGVALQISRNLIGNAEDLTAIAMVAGIGDVMPLWKETRRIVKQGLHRLNEGFPKSLQSLLTSHEMIDETSIGFQIVPKLNAIGRMDDDSNPNRVVTFLLKEDQGTIRFQADQITKVNEERKHLSKIMSQKAFGLVDEKDDFIVVYDESFAQGIVGLVAGRLVEKYRKPALVFACNNGVLHGSARSVPGFDIYEFFSDFKELTAFGGHKMAAGLSLPLDAFASFKQHIKEKMKSVNIDEKQEEKTAIQIEGKDITIENIMSLSSIKPIPRDLVQDVFAIRNPKVVKVMKREKVTKYTYDVDGVMIDGLIFHQKIADNDNPNVVIGKLCLNCWRNKYTIQMFIEAFL